MEQKGLDFGGSMGRTPERPRALSITELTERIRGVLEVEFADVWVEGEISNLTAAASGHWYFSLKDERAQIRAVVWKSSTRLIRFRPRDGMRVLARGAVRVYPPKGEYQISVEVLEPLGKGALQQAFEELKDRLGREGLFDAARKRPLPMLPRRIGVITSPTGAVIRDILRVLSNRFANLEVLLYPARVQGPEAAQEIVQGIRALNGVRGLDVLILARGGGSLEELWPFNEEPVARALAASRVPTISAVGHETDVTIADFVADLRAATPSAAAEQVVAAKIDLRHRIRALEDRLSSGMALRLSRTRARVSAVTSHRVFEAERGRIRNQAQRVDELVRRSNTGLARLVERRRSGMKATAARLDGFRWDRQVAALRERSERGLSRLRELAVRQVASRRASLTALAARLEGLSPLAVLGRGYSLGWDASGRILRDAGQVLVGEAVRFRVSRGGLTATVTAKEPA